MKLTELEIHKLYEFTKKHYVDWFDVQIELVDHLANGIEQQRQSNLNLAFDEALENEFKKFGVMGFYDVVEEKTKALNKYYRAKVWSCLINYFKLPKILLTVISVYLLFQILITIKIN